MGSGARFFLFIIFLLVVVATSAVTATFMKSGSLDDELLNKQISEFILKNPETVANAIRRAQQKEQQRAQQAASQNIDKFIDDIQEDEGTPTIGDGENVVVEFFDYNCGYCKRVVPHIQKLLAERKDVKVVFKELPILGEASVNATKAALAVYNIAPEKYFDYHNELMKLGARDAGNIMQAAKSVGIDEAKLKKAIDDPKVQQQITKHTDLAQQIGVRGTPTFIVNGELQRGAIDYDKIISLLDKKS